MEMICEDSTTVPPAAAASNKSKITSSNSNKRPSSAPPSMELISDESSLDDSMGSRSKRSCLSKKRVSWDQIHTREFALVVGDHPMCQDGLPVSLGWDHADCNSIKLKMQQQQQQAQLQEAEQQRLLKQLSERRQSYTFPRRLSYEERRDRLQSVSNLTLDQIKNDEIDLVVRTLRESWEDVDGMGEANSNIAIGDDCLMGQNDDPLLADMMGLDDIMLPGMALEGDDGDLGDISNFEWTEDDTVKAKEESSSNNSTNNNSIPTENNAGDE